MKSSLVLGLLCLSMVSMVGCGSSSGSSGDPKPAPGAFEKNVVASCKNTLTVDDLGARDELSTTRKGRYTLLAMEMYVVSSKGDSFHATATEYTGFKVQLDCNGVAATSNLRASLATPTEMNLATMASPATSRQMNVSVKAGALEEAVTELLQNDDGQPLDFSKIPKGRFQSGDSVMTVNIEPTDSAQITVTLKIESADLVEYASMIYRFR